MADTSILDKILKEVKRAKKKHPSWPVHVVAQAAIVSEESGELIRAALNYKYESRDDVFKKEWLKEMEKEAIHTSAACIRFLENLKKLEEQVPTSEEIEAVQIDYTADDFETEQLLP